MKAKNIIVLSLAATSVLFAAQPNIGDAMRQAELPKEVDKGMNNIIPALPESEIKAPMKSISGQSVEVNSFKISGNVHLSTDTLLSLLTPYAHKSYTLSELETITSSITKEYRTQGYFVARAYIPVQSMKDGVLEIAIIEGNYGAFKLSNTSLVDDATLQGMLDDIKGDNIVSTNTLERAMLIINDTPGAKVTGADVKPGQEVGTSDFDIKTEATNPYTGYILGDNYGSKYTGRNRVNVGLTANSPLGYGDKLSLNGLVSTNTDLKNGRISYGFPLMSNGLRGELSAAKTTYALGGSYEATDTVGTSTSLEASLSYPLIRTKVETLSLSLGFANKNMKDEIRSTDTITKKESNSATLGANYTQEGLFFGLESKTTATLSLTHGDLSFKNADSLALDQAGAKTDGSYSKVTGTLEKALQFNPTYSMTASLRFQKALGGKNLDGSEDFSLGGAYGVRAFPDGELSAENGYLVGAEFFYALPSYEGLSHKASLFADTGYARMENPTGATEDRQLSDVGLGYQANYKDFFAKAQLARVIGGEKVTSESVYSTKMLLQVGWVY